MVTRALPSVVVLDGCSVDPLLKDDSLWILQQAVDAGRVAVLFPHVTLDELAATPDLERRSMLLLALVTVGRLVSTGAFVIGDSFVLGASRIGHARLGDGGLEELRGDSMKRTRDALIGTTASIEGAALVTEDRRFRPRAQEHGLDVWSMPDLLTALRCQG